ncbi:MAG: YbhB/YbcL family Raf kinase inhibitor-like protein [Lachnospiraceae bacterium]|nr:YbhB/YbcL family Raf kinase inhibitor-like protein [Lachnospiraceae bacterium]
MNKKVLVFSAIIALMLVSACSKTDTKLTKIENVSKIASKVGSFNVTSDSVNEEGKLKTACCATVAAPKGENLIPHIKWDKVDGANSYAIYIYDTDAMEFIHLKVTDVSDTEIEEGVIRDEHIYIGPCPPSDTHRYQIVVYALKESVLLVEGEIGKGADIDAIESALDKNLDGETGNVVAVGTKNFTVTYNERVD